MHHLLMIGPLSYVGLVLILFFIISFFVKQQNILTRIQKIEYQNIKLEITMNILVFIAGLLFLYFDYTKNYQELNNKYLVEKDNDKKKLDSVISEKKEIKDKLSTIEKVDYEFVVQLDSIDASGNFPEASDLVCYYKETKFTEYKKAFIDNSEGEEGSYKVVIRNINQQLSRIPVLEIKDRKGNQWTIEEYFEIIPQIIKLKLKSKK